MKIFILIIAFALVIGSCKSVKNTSETSQTQLTEKTMKLDSVYRFTVSFISIGSGIDHKAQELFNKYINDYREKNNQTIVVETSKWGREGEIDYCMNLNELTVSQQELFIADIKNLLKTSTRIKYKENSICIPH
ncbi:MAG: hypothetical protein JST20_04425 [Bacteroidetes bacterium]|nr:hypothetical protein [Bacteroidota bacterium]